MKQALRLALVPFYCFMGTMILGLFLDVTILNPKSYSAPPKIGARPASLLPRADAQETNGENFGLRLELFSCASIADAAQREKLEKEINAWLSKNDDHAPMAIDLTEGPCSDVLVCIYYEPHSFRDTAKASLYFVPCADMESAQAKRDFQSGINDWLGRLYLNAATFKNMRVARLHMKNDCLLLAAIVIQ